MNEVVNQTSAIGLGTLNSSSLSILIGIAVFISIIITIFFLSRNFRSFLIGSVFTLGLFLIGWVSKFIGVETGEGNLAPLKYFVYALLFIIISIIIGKFVSKTKKWQKFEEDLKGMGENIK